MTTRFAVMADVAVSDSTMHYVESGSGTPVVFLHGNPTSHYLWRNVIGPVAAAGYRCVAPDLIGMGGSGRSANGYRLADHTAYVEEFLGALRLTNVRFVGHDWGAIIALDIARRNPQHVRGVALMECHLHPIERWTDMDDDGRELFSALRMPGIGESLVYQENVFIEQVLPSGTMRVLSSEELNEYRRPFVQPESRAPILQWAREVPIEGEPADTVRVVTRNRSVLGDPGQPTLLLYGNPGALVTEDEVAWCRDNGRNMTVVPVGDGTHFLPEDQPTAISNAVIEWLGLVERC